MSEKLGVPRSKPAGGGRLDGGNPGSAVEELKKQHPISYKDLGPHQGKSYHDRHSSLAGMHPKGSHGR